ncbi:MAG: CxxC-x17-CxxC domain-containing protein, partial [Candidatus Nealsonbacteria bacterium]
MIQGNWKCSDCGNEITELPFEPSGDRPIYC